MEMKEVLSKNLRMLLAQQGWSETELARRSGVGQRTVNALVNRESNVTLGILSRLSVPFGLEPWQLLLPNLPDDTSLQTRVEDLIGHYCTATVETQGFVDHILRHGKLTQ